MNLSLRKILKKYGVKKLLKECINNRTLFFTMASLLLNGFSKNGMELTRLGQQLKVKKRLYGKYEKKILEPLTDSKDDKIREPYVWFLWFQGIDQAPEVVKFCYEAAKKNLPDKKLILLNETNIFDYADIPEFIVKKWRSGIITSAHFSDILRTELLIKYGGTWMDATVFISDKNFPKSFFESDLFIFQKLKPGAKGNAVNLSSWFITAKPDEPILIRVRELLYGYWQNNNRLVDYFLYHTFFQLVLDSHTEYKNRIVQYPNSLPHMLLLSLDDRYTKSKMEQILSLISIHKLTYKINDTVKNDSGNIYNHLIGGIDEE
ncbi:capsular polysaccharide synthesis protein [Enterococcus avium]|uniref:capsular polysaccharide synthesis protein n=1 Tax=Enterococcus avium TaxID=33945 RepID=UPI0035CB4F01